MPIGTPTGYLDITNATLRGSQIVTTGYVGIANANPVNHLSVGSNLHINDTHSNVLQISGNINAAGVVLGGISIAPTFDLEIVTNTGNTTPYTVEFNNTATAFVTTANATIGDTLTASKLVGDGSAISEIQSSNVSDFASNVTRIGILETDLGSNVTRIETLETDFGSNVTRVETLETDLGSNVSRIGTLETDLGSNVTRIETLETDLGSNVTRITNLESGDLTIYGEKTFSSNLEVGTANLFVDTVTGKVGVGVTNPLNPLIVKGKTTIGTGASTTNSQYHDGMLNVIGGGTRAILRVENNNGVGDPTIILGEGGGFTENTVPTIKKIAGTNNLSIMTAGNVGIETTTPGAKLDVNGYILNNNPVFHAYLPTASTTTTSTGPYNFFTSTYINRGGHYYTSGTNQGKFIAPVAGVYYFSANMLHRQRGSNNNAELTFYKNGTNVSSRAFCYTLVVGGSDHKNNHIEAMIELAANDYVQVAIRTIASGTDFYTGESLSNFRGFLIG